MGSVNRVASLASYDAAPDSGLMRFRIWDASLRMALDLLARTGIAG